MRVYIMAIEKDVIKLSWDKINQYEFDGKTTLKRIIIDRESIKSLRSTEPFAFPDGTPVGNQTVRKHIYLALANLALRMLADNAP